MKWVYLTATWLVTGNVVAGIMYEKGMPGGDGGESTISYFLTGNPIAPIGVFGLFFWAGVIAHATIFRGA